MQLTRFTGAFVTACLMAVSTIALAHHSLLNYDDTTLVDVEGEVTSVFWGNPHIRFTLTSTEDGEEWDIEGGPVNQMQRRGIQRDTVSVGDVIQVSGIKSNRSNAMMPVRIVAGGQAVVLDVEKAESFGILQEGEAPVAAVADAAAVEEAIRNADGIFRTWTNRGWIDRYREWGMTQLPLTAEAQAAQDGWYQPRDDLALRCIKAGMPEAQLNPFPIEFIPSGENIEMRIEEWENVRTIYLDGSTSAGAEPSPLGYSVGRWEDNTLVIETDKINAPFFDDRGTPQTEDVRIVERFTLSEDETRLDWEATVYDDATFTQPMVMPDLHWEWVPGETIKSYSCTPDTAGTPWGARRDE